MDEEENSTDPKKDYKEYMNTVDFLARRIFMKAIEHRPTSVDNVKHFLEFRTRRVVLSDRTIIYAGYGHDNMDTSFFFDLQNKETSVRRKFLVEVVAQIMHLIDDTYTPVQRVHAQINENIPQIMFTFKYRRKEG